MNTKTFKDVLVNASGQAVVVTGRSPEFIDGRPLSGEASATELRPGVWWVNRVLIQPPSVRGQGLGGHLLDTLIKHLTEQEHFKRLFVQPGGYNLPVGRQRKFYRRHGFKPVRATPGVLRWTKKGMKDAKASLG